MRFSEQMAGSARALNALLQEFMDEAQILRIDHFLGKQLVLDIHVLRFANSLLSTSGTANTWPRFSSHWPRSSAGRPGRLL
jgi:glucose-6-phosphate 1-dehydrogenase